MHENAASPAAAAVLLLAAWSAPLGAQVTTIQIESHQVVVPQARAFAVAPGAQEIQVTGVTAEVEILERAATTTLDVHLSNPSAVQEEAVLLLPVPQGAVVTSFLFEGAAAEPTARLLPADEARRTYEEIVRKARDPALLEFAGFHSIRSSVFPVPPNGTQRLRVVYEQVLAADGNRIDYLLPRSESVHAQVPWRIQARIRCKSPLAMIYSPSHELEIEKVGPHHALVRLPAAQAREPGHFLMSYLLERGGVSASLMAYPDPRTGGGYFLLLAGLPAGLAAGNPAIQREVTLVLDRSGSMAGEKLDQAKAAALQILEGLQDGEAFNVIDYSTTVSSFAPRPLVKTRERILEARRYLDGIRPNGGTNIHDALLEALRQEPAAGAAGRPMLPIVLFLTDGLPTVGRTGERDIRRMVEAGNPHRRRIFTFGVGADVNAPLLDRLAESTRAVGTYVLPGEDVELKVARMFRRLHGPVLANARLETLDGAGEVTTLAVRELIPDPLPDLYEGDEIVLLGQYRDAAGLSFRLSGDAGGQRLSYAFSFSLHSASARNSFVPRLWASRRIAYLVDQIRQAGAETGSAPFAALDPLADPRLRELVEEILRLSTEFGVLSEYTAFLATEGTDFSDWNGLLASCNSGLEGRAIQERSGLGAVNQSLNLWDAKSQSKLNLKNSYLDDKLQRVEFTAVQQVCDRAFFKNGEQWIDGRLIQNFKEVSAAAEIRWGTDEYLRLLDLLAAQGRQGVLSLKGQILMEVDGETVLVRNEY